MPGKNLTKIEAAKRAEIISNVSYVINLKLRPEGETFSSLTRINFKAKEGAATFVDIIAPKVKTVVLNGEMLDPAKVYVDSRIELTNLAEQNELLVEADCAYMHTGEGMHRFTDPADGLTYVYTQFEVPDARRVYACFEQPDLKATYQFNVNVPKDWIALSNQIRPEATIPADGCSETHTFAFPTTMTMSTYITAIVAGPYYGVTDELISSDGRVIPLGVYCRQSLKEYLDAEFVFKQTKAGFKFYENEFNRPYPFENYDQIFVPEYNAGAMENAGCVTFTDFYIFRTKPNRGELQNFCNTILHELAHMWFGDLVTMRWWNDLWLNESFAEFMSYLAMAEGTEFSDAWTGFGIRKMWGLNCDQMPTTHPIVAPINDLADVEVNFDGITYSKGACVLRQLVSYVGRQNFMKALTNYFEKYAYSNATLEDLLAELAATSGRDLDAWTEKWLLQAGITELQAKIERNADGSVAKYLVEQKLVQEGTTHRPHSMVIGAYDFDTQGNLVRKLRVEAEVDGEVTEIKALKGTNYPVYVLNDEDVAYAKIRLDAESQAVIDNHIDKFIDSMPRMVILCATWDAVRDGDISATRFIKMAAKALSHEENANIIGGVLNYIRSAARFYAADNQAASALAAQAILDLAEKSKEGSDRQRQMVEAFLGVAGLSFGDKVKTWHAQGQSLQGIKVDTEFKWDLVLSLAKNNLITESEINKQLAADDTLAGREKQMCALTALADVKNKKEWMAKIYDAKTLTNGQLSYVIAAFYAGIPNLPELQKIVVDRYFEVVPEIWEKCTLHIADSIISGMYPLALVGRGEIDIVDRTEKWLAANSELPRALLRLMRENLDAAHRIARAQAKDRA